MKIYFVRHGHPDYTNDCLTKLGHAQAASVAERLAALPITRIFSSTKGRALQTADYTAKKLGLEVTPCDFMREIGWWSVDGTPIPADGHPWALADLLASQGIALTGENWREREPFCKSVAVKYIKTVTDGLDSLLLCLGYRREGEYYRVVGEDTDISVAIFSHAGSSSAAMSHLLNIPFPQFCGTFALELTGVIVIELSNEQGKLVCPKLISSDASHLKNKVENVYGD